MCTNRKVLVIGCGIGGPAVALFLQRAGFEVEIFEAQDEPDDAAGLFLNVASNGMDVLQTLGVAETLRCQGFPCSRTVLWNEKGKRLGEVPNGFPDAASGGSVIVKRGVLHGTLHRAALAVGIPVRFGKRMQEIRTGADGRVTAAFMDGTQATGDLLVGCDGIHSPTRRFVLPDAPAPSYVGLLSGGGFARSHKVAPTPDTQHLIFGKHAFFGYLAKASGEIYWFENHEHGGQPRRSELEAVSQAEWTARLLALHAEDQPFISDIIRASESEIVMYPIYDMPTLARWHRGPVVLLGDAIHATSPSAGQGASLALEDAIVLAQCLRDIADPESAFTTYEQTRRERVERIVKAARDRNGFKTQLNPVTRWFRDLMMPFFLRTFAQSDALKWMYTYRVDWAQPVRVNGVHTP